MHVAQPPRACASRLRAVSCRHCGGRGGVESAPGPRYRTRYKVFARSSARLMSQQSPWRGRWCVISGWGYPDIGAPSDSPTSFPARPEYYVTSAFPSSAPILYSASASHICPCRTSLWPALRSAKTLVVILAQLCQFAAQPVDLLVGVLQLAREFEDRLVHFDGFDQHDFSLSMFHW